MKRKALLLGLLALVTLASCGGGSGTSLSRVDIESIIPSTTVKEVLVSDLKEDEYNKIPDYYFDKLEGYKTYKAITSGSTKSHVAFFDIDQSIEVTLIKSDYSYMINESHSSLVNTSHEVYYHDSKALYKDMGDADFSLSSLEDYLGIYGVNPFERAIEGYKIDGSTKIERIESNGDYKFKFSFDPESSTNNVRIQMKKFGGLDDYPVFKDISLVLTIKNDFTPVSIELESHYDAKKIMGTECHQMYTVTFSNYNENIDIPNLDDIKNKFTK